jgi:methionine salvage enolase-phosphatase E1
VYEDVLPALAAWTGAGVRVHVYSSGSEEAQRLLFGHSVFGDMSAVRCVVCSGVLRQLLEVDF